MMVGRKKIRIPTEPCLIERFTLTVVITTAYVATHVANSDMSSSFTDGNYIRTNKS